MKTYEYGHLNKSHSLEAAAHNAQITQSEFAKMIYEWRQHK